MFRYRRRSNIRRCRFFGGRFGYRHLGSRARLDHLRWGQGSIEWVLVERVVAALGEAPRLPRAAPTAVCLGVAVALARAEAAESWRENGTDRKVIALSAQ